MKLVNNHLSIRDVRPGELDEAARVIKEAYQEYETSIPPPFWQTYVADMMDVRSRLDKADLIVAEWNGHLAGAVTLYLKGASSEHEDWPPGWAGIRLLAVRPAYRGLGIGRALMEECIRRCREHGIATLGLHTSDLMAVARSMYEKMGFQRVPEFDFHPAPGRLVMAYRLEV